jgi:aminoglycoside phosphotransferase (APT) family kinase protein
MGIDASLGALCSEPLGRRAVRYTAAVSRQGGAGLQWRVVGKFYEDAAAGQRGWEAMQEVASAGFAGLAPAWVRIPECYGYFPQWCLLLMEEAPGRPLKALVKRRLAGPEHMRLFAEALVKVHRLPARRPPFTLEDHLRERCDDLPGSLCRAIPELGGDVDMVLSAARRIGNGDGRAVAHGDYHLGQANLEDGAIWILDLDRLHAGDPAYDLAMVFLVFKRLQHGAGEADYIRSLRDAFIAAYFAQTDWRVARRIPLHEALIHLKRACKRFKWQEEAGWEETVRSQVRQAAVCVSVLERAAPPCSLADVVAMYDRCPGDV